ncbi:7-carboxy-7-deazaguanine synthase QueE [Vampirovibrio sp.]|uniref:7-carboxy-7-deazaguanine synthase QueE n=1 Tax=Vampirovibrio sp. TaxID=2717857 RepID=UPI0035938777
MMLPLLHTSENSASLATKTAPLQEIFSSVQGEGIYVGKRQIFVRFAHCHLKCAYCDTPMTSPSGQCHVELPPGSGQIHYYPNPMQPETLVELIQELLPTARHHSVSFTGGEPLLYHQFLSTVFPLIQSQSKTYLETSGTQASFLESVLPWTDIIAMDIKLPSATGEAPQFENHAAFYKLAHSHPPTECFIKLVFNENTTIQELAAVEEIVFDRKTPIILQPETSLKDRKVYLNPAKLFEVENYLAARFEDVRVIPQTHKMLNVL